MRTVADAGSGTVLKASATVLSLSVNADVELISLSYVAVNVSVTEKLLLFGDQLLVERDVVCAPVFVKVLNNVVALVGLGIPVKAADAETFVLPQLLPQEV